MELKGRVIKLETRKAAALLAYLSLTPGECQREILATMFWPEGSQHKSLANLRRTLSSLNSSLPGWIEADRETINLKRNGRLWVDVESFHQSLSQLKEHSHPENEVCDECLSALDKTVELYRGDFMEGLNLTDAPNLDEWQFFQRDGLRQQFADVLQRLSSIHSELGQWDQAIVHARRWVAMDRLHEPVHAGSHQFRALESKILLRLGVDHDDYALPVHQQDRVRGGFKDDLGSFLRLFAIGDLPLHFPLVDEHLRERIPQRDSEPIQEQSHQAVK